MLSARRGPTPDTASSEPNSAFSSAFEEAEQLQGVLAQMGVDRQRDPVALLGQSRKGVERDQHLIADAVHVDDQRVGGLVRELSGQARDHRRHEVRERARARRPPRAACLLQRRLETAGVQVAERRAEGIRLVGLERRVDAEQSPHHQLHLRLRGAPVPATATLISRRAVLDDGDSGLGGGDQNRAARLAEAKRALDVVADEGLLQADARRARSARRSSHSARSMTARRSARDPRARIDAAGDMRRRRWPRSLDHPPAR